MLAGLAAAALSTTGCASSTSADTPAFGGTTAAGPIDTGTYPNLNVAPRAATEQFTPGEAAAKLAALQTVRQTQAPGATAETEEARRRRLKLLGDGQSDTLQVIESQ
jgi:hypothetical protein